MNVRSIDQPGRFDAAKAIQAQPPVAEEVLASYDFYRCNSCQGLLTNPEVKAALGPEGTGHPCGCGGTHLRPCNLPWWGWAFPKVWVFAVARLRGQA